MNYLVTDSLTEASFQFSNNYYDMFADLSSDYAKLHVDSFRPEVQSQRSFSKFYRVKH